ncbi:MAG: ATP-binding cassette domain-containing protein [Ignavibacteriaceae bacterium]|nr:ATP-binding cassette domain-containing protein [Ignavibacteriaceae bacterium]
MKNILNITGLCCDVEIKDSVFGKSKKKRILNNISFSFERGKILGISGKSGSGKTTLAKCICGVIPPSSGKIKIEVTNPESKSRSAQLLFQNSSDIVNPYRKIYRMVEEAIDYSSQKIEDRENEIKEIFETINFPSHLWHKRGFQLSGGEQQRAALARILAVRPELLVLDEPFSAQDVESQLNLVNLFLKIKEKLNVSIICISHDLKILRKLCDEIIILFKGEIVEKGTTEKVFSNPTHPYTKFLLKSENYDLSYEELQLHKEALE